MNNQKPEKLIPAHPEGELIIHSIFPTIQGEGIFAGDPATFVRLAGCNLRCPACDTDYTSVAELNSVKFIKSYIDSVSAPNKLVVITGGEPFRQDISVLVTTLVDAGYRIQIETNGTLPPTYDVNKYSDNVWIMCSPKVGRLHKDLIPHVSAYKYVVGYNEVDLIDGLPTRVLGLKSRPARPPQEHERLVFIQPMDSKDAEVNGKHLQAAKESALNHGYTLCLQIHKIINVE